MMKNYIIPFLVVVSVIIATHLFVASVYEKKMEEYKEEMADKEGQLRYCKQMFSWATAGMGNSLKGMVCHQNKEMIKMDNCIDYPCLLIYVPAMENLCMSCVNYAISSVQKLYEDIWNTSHIGIVTCGYNGELKERILKKKILFVDEDIFSIENFNNPVYLLVDKEKRIVSAFMPNEIMERWTDSYLKSVRPLLE